MKTRRSPRNQDILWRVLAPVHGLAPKRPRSSPANAPAPTGREWNPLSVRHDRRCLACGLWTQGGSRRAGTDRYIALCEYCNRKEHAAR